MRRIAPCFVTTFPPFFRSLLVFFNTLIKACSSTIGPRDALISRAVGFILSSFAAPARARVRLLNTKWIVKMSARSNSWRFSRGEKRLQVLDKRTGKPFRVQVRNPKGEIITANDLELVTVKN